MEQAGIVPRHDPARGINAATEGLAAIHDSIGDFGPEQARRRIMAR